MDALDTTDRMETRLSETRAKLLDVQQLGQQVDGSAENRAILASARKWKIDFQYRLKELAVQKSQFSNPDRARIAEPF